MFAKAVVLVVALGACGCTLLSMRQSRLQAASELVQIQLKVRQQDEQLWKLRTRISAAVTPENVRVMAGGIGPLRPLRPERPGLLGDPESRQFVKIAPAPLQRSPLPPLQARPVAAPAKPKPKDAGKSERARLATVDPQR